MKIKRHINIIVGFLFLAAAVALWAMPPKTAAPARSDGVSRVELDRVRAGDHRQGARFAGVTQAKNRAVLSFSVPARVIERPVTAGSRVDRGAVLARLDDGEYRNAADLAEAAVAELKTQWEQACRDRRRIQKLTASRVATVSDLEKVTTREKSLEAALQAATARLEEARRLLHETVLKAPFDGTVTGLHIQAGEWAGPGQPAIELTGDGDIELVVEVPESAVTRLSAGQPVKVLLPFAGNRVIPGRISTVARAAIAAGRLFPVKVDLADAPGLRAGLTAQLLVELAAENTLTVPLAAVVNPGASQPFIFIYDQGRVSRRPVVLGTMIDDRIVVRGDVTEGDQVVVTGQSQLADGDRIEAVTS
jgi:membrane fusion protein, multidrug efflux system